MTLENLDEVLSDVKNCEEYLRTIRYSEAYAEIKEALRVETPISVELLHFLCTDLISHICNLRQNLKS